MNIGGNLELPVEVNRNPAILISRPDKSQTIIMYHNTG
jgi:hypothetical protein